MKMILSLLLLLTARSTAFAINIDSLKTVIVAEKNINAKIKLYNLLCNNLEGLELLRITTGFYNYSELNNSENGIALASDNLGYYYQTLKPDSAIYFYEKALAYYTKVKNTEEICHFYNELGVCYYVKGNLNRSLVNYLKALGYATGEESVKATTLNNVAQIYTKLGETEKALETYKKVIELFTKKGNLQMAAAVNQNIGMMFTEKYQYDKAEKYLLIALNGISQEHPVYSQVLANLGLNYTLQGDAGKGKIYLQKALTLLRKKNNSSGLAYVLANLGTAYSKLGKNYEAIKYGLEGFELSKQLGFLDNMERTSHMLSRIFEVTGDYKNALKYNKIYLKMHDSIVSESVVKQLNALNVEYESNKKDYELLKQADVIDKKEILIQRQNIEAERKAKFIYILAFAGVMVLLIAVFVFRAYKQKQKANNIITAQKQEVEKQKSIIELQKEIVEEHQKEILDSIHYAKRIQRALLPTEKYISKHIKK